MKLKKIIVLAAISFVIAISSGVSSTSVYASDGEKVFKKCKSCHNFKKNGVGPNLSGIVDRKAGSLKFKYSKAMKIKASEGLVWTEANLDKFLKKPRSFIKKTRMAFGGLKKDKDRKALIEYLKGK
jgi:cytochrome c2